MLTGALIRALFISVAIFCYLGCRNNADAIFFYDTFLPFGSLWPGFPIGFPITFPTEAPPIIETNTVGTFTGNVYDIPPKSWLFTSSVERKSSKVYEVFGREIYISDVTQMLSDVIKKDYLPFPVQHSTASEAPYEVIIRADTLYLDVDVTLQGLKKLKILARRMIANNKKLTLKAPEVCQSISGSTCEQLGKAAQATAGRNGRNGIPSTSVEIYVYSIDGNVEVISQASNGARGESGGDGVAGGIGRDATGVPGCSGRCDSRGGYNGGNGGDGGDGQKAGGSGKGGTAKKVIVSAAKVSGLFKVTKPKAVGGEKATNGNGASGGRGGIGGCGKRCEWKTGSGRFSSKRCSRNTDCGLRGSTGSTGKHGRNGNDIYGQPNNGINGDDETDDLKIGSIKAWFSGEDDLLELIYRRGEFDFLKNRTDKALEIFDFLMSATDEGSSMHTKASTLKIALENGFDFYGNAKYYAPTKHWDYYSDTSRGLLVTGTAYENAFNTVKEKMDDVKQLSGALKLQMAAGYTDSTRELLSDLNAQTSRKGVYINALTKIEVMMRNQRQEINKLLSEAIVEKNKPKAFSVLDFFDGVTGFVGGFTGSNPWQTYDSAVKLVKMITDEPGCNAPTILDAQTTLKSRIEFAFQSAGVDYNNFSLPEITNVDAVPIIMRSKLAKNKRKLFQEFSCLLDTEDKSDTVANLQRVMEDFFGDADLRISLIDKIISIQIQIILINDRLTMIRQGQSDLDTVVDSSINNIPMSIKRTFTDYVFNLYQQQEAEIMHSLYDLAKASQFLSLWKFNAFHDYVNAFSDRPMMNNLGSLNGIFHLQSVKGKLESERKNFLDTLDTTAGEDSHTYTVVRIYNKAEQPAIFKNLEETGRFTITIDLEPNNIVSVGCDSCYNGRLVSMYVDLGGSAQPENVPDDIYVKVAHMGNSYFLLPLSDGTKTSVYLQQEPQNIYGGNVMSFDRKDPVTSVSDDSLEDILHNPLGGHKFCTLQGDAEKFYGGQMCKSPYATYTVTVPKTPSLPCNVAKARGTSGTNCKDLDYSKFDKVRVYAYVRSFSSYPFPSMTSFIDS